MVDLLTPNIEFILPCNNEHTCGNKVIDDFISYTRLKTYGKMEFVPYDKFTDVEFIAEGGFSKIYKATWKDGPRNWNAPLNHRSGAFQLRGPSFQVAL